MKILIMMVLLIVSMPLLAAPASWVEPTTYVNGDTLDPAKDIVEYHIFSSAIAGGPYDTLVANIPGGQNSAVIDLHGQEAFLVITALATNGQESDPSNEVHRDAVDPSAPTVFTVNVSGTLTIQLK